MKKKRKAVPIQVSPELNLLITNYATKKGMTRTQAADDLFGILYPEGPGPEKKVTESSEEESETTTKGDVQTFMEDPISRELQSAVRDLRAVRTMKELSSINNSGGPTKEEDEEEKYWQRFFKKKRLDLMTDGEGAKGSSEIQALRQEIQGLNTKITDLTSKRAEEERDFYKTALEKKEESERRTQEMASVTAPLNEQLSLLSQRVEGLASRVESGSLGELKKEPSEELEAIKELASGIRDAVEGLKNSVGGSAKENLGIYIDNLSSLIDKVQGLTGKIKKEGGGEEGTDWKSTLIATSGEVLKEGFEAFKAAQSAGPTQQLDQTNPPPDQATIDQRVIEHRVFNYAVKKIGEGVLELNTAEASRDLNLTPEQVFNAVQSLQQKKMLTTMPQGGKPSEQSQGTEKETQVGEGVFNP